LAEVAPRSFAAVSMTIVGPNPHMLIQIIVANCIAHGRRKFVEVATKFPEECRYVLETLGEVYQHDAF
jgi:hypothetical protein